MLRGYHPYVLCSTMEGIELRAWWVHGTLRGYHPYVLWSTMWSTELRAWWEVATCMLRGYHP